MASSEIVGCIQAHCQACGWEYERDLDAGTLGPEENQNIGARVARSHSFKCQTDGEEDWGKTTDVDVQLDMAGGDQ